MFLHYRTKKTQSTSQQILVYNRLTLNSCSRKLNRLSSQDNSKAVKIGSLDDSAVKEHIVYLRYSYF